MMKSDLDAKAARIYKTITRDHMQPMEMIAFKDTLDLGIAVIAAVFSIANSLETIARAKRVEMGWRPTDDQV